MPSAIIDAPQFNETAFSADFDELKWKLRWFYALKHFPHPAQMLIHKNDARFIIAVCGRRWGKTFAAKAEILPVLMRPGTRVWVVAPNYALADKVFREVFHTLKRTLGLKGGVGTSDRAGYQKFVVEFGDGLAPSVLEAKSAENADSLIGEGLDLLVMDEAARVAEKVWEEALRPTLIDRKGRAILISTPRGKNWLYYAFARGLDPQHPDWYSIQSSSYENPHLDRSELDQMICEMSKDAFEQEIMASFNTFQGRVFKEFSRKRGGNLVDVSSIPIQKRLEMDICAGLDFGIRGATAVIWFLHDKPNRAAYGFREYIASGLTADRLTAKMHEIEDTFPRKVHARYCDPAGRAREQTSGLSMVQKLGDWGLPCRWRVDDLARNVPSGIEHLKSLIQDATGKRHLFFDPKGCPMTIHAHENISYPQGTDAKDLSEKPLKDGITDHPVDATKYFAVNAFPILRGRYAGGRWK